MTKDNAMTYDEIKEKLDELTAAMVAKGLAKEGTSAKSPSGVKGLTSGRARYKVLIIPPGSRFCTERATEKLCPILIFSVRLYVLLRRRVNR